MIIGDTKYYFSTKALIFATLFIGIIATFCLSLFFMIYKDSLTYGILFLSPLFLIIIALPDYLRQLYCVITKKPALELTKDLLIDNSKGHIYKWTEIQGAFYKPYTGYKALPSGYIEITFVGSDKK